MAISAGFAIVAASRDDRAGYAVFKPLTTVIILLGARFLVLPAPPLYRNVIVLGLALSLAGDVLLLAPRRFALGLAAFLLADVAYLAAFSINTFVKPGQLVWLLPFLAAGGAVTWYVWTGLGTLRPAVVVSVAVVALAAWRAAMRLGAPWIPLASQYLALAGATLLLASQAVLAVRRFRRPFPASRGVELGLYAAAQFLIALSVRS